MNRKLLKSSLLTGLIFIAQLLMAQTKIIAHKSHSGSNETFKIVYDNNLFDIENSNLGVAPERTVYTAALDSIIFISDTSAVMVTSEYCNRRSKAKTTKWRAGKDTVYNHFLFNKNKSIDFIKTYLKQNYHFQNSIDSVKFIRLEQQQDQREYQSLPVAGISGGSGNSTPTGSSPGLWLSLIILFSLVAGSMHRLLSRFQKAY